MRGLKIGLVLGACLMALPAVAAEVTTEAVLKNYAAIALAGYSDALAKAEDLDAAVDRWVQDILACAPLSLRAIKQVMRRTAHLSPTEAQALRLPALVAALQSEDSNEGVRAFREKRKPVWQGR